MSVAEIGVKRVGIVITGCKKLTCKRAVQPESLQQYHPINYDCSHQQKLSEIFYLLTA